MIELRLRIFLLISIYKVKNYEAASILTFIVHIIFSIFGGFEKWLLDYLPGRIVTRVTELLYGTEDEDIITLLWLIIVTIIISAILFKSLMNMT